MKASGYAAMERGAALQPFDFELGDPGPYEVVIKITHCGLCHSDLHFIDADLGYVSAFPLVPGHEIVGTVERVGDLMTEVKVGDRVGVGYQCKACLDCEWCRRSMENFCKKRQATVSGRPGGFASHIRVDGRFAYPIPKALASEHAAPLLCAGHTVYSALRRHGAGPDVRVGIVGFGGLGHIGVLLAKAMGCEVTVISSNVEKKADAEKMGANRFLSEKNEEQIARWKESLDLIVDTAPGGPNAEKFFDLLRPNGRLVVVSRGASEIRISSTRIMASQMQIAGSITGGRVAMTEMLNFAAWNGIKPWVEVMPMDRVNEAIARLRAGKARYRIVLTN
ncbi:MAG TPA: NAD(P)-dependent alcohol dehydrogenase [Methanomassiliicoccales archaeon]|nr:NAD(P)-dependent alcohol dehydrogenase [Methanomassiliicoccales archaeon]